MPNAFNFSVSPFDCLDPAEQRLVRDQVDIACFRPGCWRPARGLHTCSW